ncbi:MAG: PDZ domain-containing protein, partial [Planctomycetota bacterium]|nr:PDZ domain-containing protein [Planctomycetota bacterium]
RNRGKLGVTVENNGEVTGLRISRIRKASAAETGGLHVNDYLLSIANIALKSKDDLRRALGGKIKGDVINVSYIRNGEKNSATITLK